MNSPAGMLVVWWAPWSDPCRALAPALAVRAYDQAARLKVVKRNVGTNPNWLALYRGAVNPDLAAVP